MLQNRKGFTLIELLVVIGIVGILLSITIVAINPARQFKLANDTSRSAGINSIGSAISQMLVDNKGSLPFSVSTLDDTPALTSIKSATSPMQNLCYILTGLSATSTASAINYIVKLPTDPTTGAWTSCADFNTGFELSINSTGRFDINAPSAELTSISVSR